MTNQSTIDKLIEMRLTTMADAFRNQLDDPKFKEVPFEDRFGLLVDIEFSSRKNNRLKRLIRNAGFDQPEASIMDINYSSGRKLNKELINRLATCEYISDHRNLFITGATGCGKTYMACAFGMEACKQYFNTRYVRLPDLLIDLEIARSDGYYKKVMAKYANPLVSLNFSIEEGRNPQPSSARSTNLRTGTTSLVVMQVHWQMRLLIALLMTVIVSTSQVLTLITISPCEKFMV